MCCFFVGFDSVVFQLIVYLLFFVLFVGRLLDYVCQEFWMIRFLIQPDKITGVILSYTDILRYYLMVVAWCIYLPICLK